MRKEILNQIKGACNNYPKEYMPLFAKNPTDVDINITVMPSVQKLLDINETGIKQSKNENCLTKNKIITMPNENYFLSNSNYNHVIKLF